MFTIQAQCVPMLRSPVLKQSGGGELAMSVKGDD